MPPLNLAVCLKSFGRPLRQSLAAARELGFTAIELDARGEIHPQELSLSGVRQLRKLIEDHGLRVVAVDFFTRRGYDAEEELDRRIEATRSAMRLAHDLGAHLVVNQVGHVPEELEGDRAQRHVAVLHDLCAYGHKVGATLAAETGSEPGTRLAALVAALPDGYLGVAFDPGNLAINGFDVMESAVALSRSISHVHAHDGVRDRSRGRGLEVELGRGSVDFPALLATLEEGDYRGHVSIERDASADAAGDIARALKYLNSL